MRWITYLQKESDIDLALESRITEVICSCRDFSRDFNTSKSEMISMLKVAKQKGLKTIFEWDIIETENFFNRKINLFKTLPLEFIDAIRVQDAGVMYYVFHETSKPLQLIKENKDHNLVGLKRWESYLGERLERICLSNELNKTKILQYASELNTPVEILGYGKILLFYTPRNLLSAVTNKENNETLRAVGSSEESPHSGFPIIENMHGSFMYHIKDLYLLDRMDELKDLNIETLRVDLRDKDIMELPKITAITNNYDGEKYKEQSNLKVTRGYFQTNKSDVLFKKLKNTRIQRKDASYIGEILEIQNKEYMALLVKSKKLSLGDEVKFISPDGKEYLTHLASLRDTNMENVSEVSKGSIAILKYKGGVWPKSQVYFQ